VFSTETELADRYGMPIPCLPIGGEGDRLAPVSFEGAFGVPSNDLADYPTKLERHIPFRALEELFAQFHSIGSPADFEEIGPYKAVSVNFARDSFVLLATEFLATRLASLHPSDGYRPGFGDAGDEPVLELSRPGGGPPIRTPGCTFVVTTNSFGLRVHWSGAYYIAPNYFNSPTSPVSRILQSGTYIFGVDGGTYPTIQWDTNAIVSLPGSPSIHLNY
jgi:hypothetical protein